MILPIEVTRDYDITVVAVYVNIDGKSYPEGMDLSRSEHSSQLPSYAASPTTSAPGPAAYEQAAQRARLAL